MSRLITGHPMSCWEHSLWLWCDGLSCQRGALPTSLAQQGATHPPSGRVSWSHSTEKCLSPSLVPYHWRDWDLCQCSASGRHDCLCWIRLCFVTGWSTDCKHRAGECPSGISLFEWAFFLGFIRPSASKGADKSSQQYTGKIIKKQCISLETQGLGSRCPDAFTVNHVMLLLLICSLNTAIKRFSTPSS